MSLEQAQWILGLIGAYALAGLVFALGFIARGVERVDPQARGMPWAARLLLLPGAALLWPLMLTKWLRPHTPPTSDTRVHLQWHRWAWRLATPALALLLVLALWDRPPPPMHDALPGFLVAPVTENR